MFTGVVFLCGFVLDLVWGGFAQSCSVSGLRGSGIPELQHCTELQLSAAMHMHAWALGEHAPMACYCSCCCRSWVLSSWKEGTILQHEHVHTHVCAFACTL